MTQKFVFLFFMLVAAYMLQLSVSIAQNVNQTFKQPILKENFDTSSTSWTIVSNTENFFIVQEGEYILNRKSNISPFAIVCGFENKATQYKLITSLKLDKASTDKNSLGLLFQLQQDKKGGLLFEISAQKQFRIREINVDGYKYITGDVKNEGWIRSNYLHQNGIANLIELRFKDGLYDFYINTNFTLSCNNAKYSTGNFGFVIGPASKGKIDFLYLFTADTSDKMNPAGADDDVINLAESIINLKTLLNNVSLENELLLSTLEAMKQEAKLFNQEKQKLVIANEQKQLQYNNLILTNDSLVKVNNDLNKYKLLFEANNAGDIVINLSKALKAEKEKNTKLQEQLDNIQKQQEINKTIDTVPEKILIKPTENFNLPK